MSSRGPVGLLLLVLAALLAYWYAAAPPSAPAPRTRAPPPAAPPPAAPPKRDPGYYKQVFKPGRLYLPTLIEKYGEQYFIVDTYNNRVIYSRDLTAPIDRWQTLDDKLSLPHSIASNLSVYVVDDTEADLLRVYRRAGDGFVEVQSIGDIGIRPHRVLYDEATAAFYAFAAHTQQISKLTEDAGRLRVEYTRYLPFLDGAYARSMRIIDGRMAFVSGPGRIHVVDYRDDAYAVVETFAVPASYAGMNDLFKVGEDYYLTATMNLMLRCPSLDALATNGCESVYDKHGLRGNPYYFSRFDGRIYLGEVAGRDAIVEFEESQQGLRLTRLLPGRQP